MNKKRLLIPFAALSLAALAGCGNKATDNSIHVLFWHTFGDKAETSLKNKAAKFQTLVKENEGKDVVIEFNHLGGYKDVKRIVGSALEAGNGPTMTVSYPDSVAALMAKETTPGQYIVNVGEFFDDPNIGFGTDEYLGDDKEGTTDFIQTYLQEGQVFSKAGTYVMPYMKSSEIMLYNKTAAVAAYKKLKGNDKTTAEAVEYVENMSFNELMELAKVCVDNKKELGFGSMEYPVFYDSDSNFIITQIEQAGLKYSTLEQGSVKLGLDFTADNENAKAVQDILDSYRQWHASKYITTKATEGTYASDSFKNQKCFFTIGSSGGAGYSFPETGSFDFGICRVPYYGEHSAASYSNAKFISQGPSIAFCNDKSLSAESNKERLTYGWKFYKYITNTEINVELCVNGSEGYVPVRNSCYSDEAWAEFISDPENNYALCAKVLRDKINGKFLTSLVFNGSDTYRDEMTGLVANAMKAADKNAIAGLMNTAVNNTKNAMK